MEADTMPASQGSISFNFPMLLAVPSAKAAPSATTGFSVDAQGTGSFTGLSYTVPAHTKGTLKAKIQVQAITTADVDALNKLVMGMLDASHKTAVDNYSKTHVSGNLSFFSFLTGGASASYDKTHHDMSSMGLTESQMDTVVEKMFDLASKMSHVELDFTIDNSANDYSVSGDLQLYTISGTIKTSKGDAQYRLLSDKGTAGGGAAPAEGKVIPLS
jgi:hypothetical protein